MAVDFPIPVLVLAGGASRRMGTDKRLVEVDGVPMLLRTLDRLAPAPALVVVDPRHPTSVPLPPHAHIVADSRPGEGPLAAVEAGLLATDAPVALVVAADMPWLEPAVLWLLADHVIDDLPTDVACLADEQGPRPLPLALRTRPTRGRVTQLLDAGERRLRALLADASVVPSSVWLPLDPARGTLRDVDTPADLVTVP